MRRHLGEIAIAIAAGALGWLAAPSAGVGMHWSPDGGQGWSAPPLWYAFGSAIVAFALGRAITWIVAQKTGLEQAWPATTAAGVLCVAYAALQRVGAEVPLALPLAAGIAVMLYFVTLALTLRVASRRSRRP